MTQANPKDLCFYTYLYRVLVLFGYCFKITLQLLWSSVFSSDAYHLGQTLSDDIKSEGFQVKLYNWRSPWNLQSEAEHSRAQVSLKCNLLNLHEALRLWYNHYIFERIFIKYIVLEERGPTQTALFPPHFNPTAAALAWCLATSAVNCGEEKNPEKVDVLVGLSFGGLGGSMHCLSRDLNNYTAFFSLA